MIRNNTIFISGGGTGGHLFPALTIGNKLEEIGYNIKYIGSKFGIESNYYKNKNIEAELLDIYGIDRNFTLRGIMNNLLFPFKFIKSYINQLVAKIIYWT